MPTCSPNTVVRLTELCSSNIRIKISKVEIQSIQYSLAGCVNRSSV